MPRFTRQDAEELGRNAGKCGDDWGRVLDGHKAMFDYDSSLIRAFGDGFARGVGERAKLNPIRLVRNARLPR